MTTTNEKGEMIFIIKESNGEHDWERNNDYFNQWRKQFDNYCIEFVTNAMLAAADMIRERSSLETKKQS